MICLQTKIILNLWKELKLFHADESKSSEQKLNRNFKSWKIKIPKQKLIQTKIVPRTEN